MQKKLWDKAIRIINVEIGYDTHKYNTCSRNYLPHKTTDLKLAMATIVTWPEAIPYSTVHHSYSERPRNKIWEWPLSKARLRPYHITSPSNF